MSHVSVQSPPAVSQLRVRARASRASPPRPPATRASTPAVLFWPHGLHRCLGALVPCTFTTPADSAPSSDHCSELPFSGRSSYGFAKAPVTKSHMLSGLRDRNGLSCGSGGWSLRPRCRLGVFPPRHPSWAWRWSSSPRVPSMNFLMCICVPVFSSSYKETSHPESGPTLRISF